MSWLEICLAVALGLSVFLNILVICAVNSIMRGLSIWR